MVGNQSSGIKFIKQYCEYKLRLFRWVIIPKTEAEAMKKWRD